jgi:hypothetical protein
MNFLIALLEQIFITVLKWLLESGGRFLYEKVNQIIDEHDKKKIREDNLKRYKDALDNNLQSEERRQRQQDLINGTDRRHK